MSNGKVNSKSYDPSITEPKWQRIWEKSKIYQPDLDKVPNPFYNLMMFPYPSAEGLHVGNMYAFTGSDIFGRFKRMQGFEVFEPIGLDGFGIHSENYAIKLNRHPSEVARQTEKNFYRQLRATGNAYAWDNTLETYNSSYYKWTQWVFIQMYKHGLAYRKKASVNWCPSCKTVLSDEQVTAGTCERCNSIVERRELEQWFFKITDYAERLLKNLEWIDWSWRVKKMQRNWIGRSEGVEVVFDSQAGELSVFTTRPDTIFGTTFFVISPEHPQVKKLVTPQFQQEVERYCKTAARKSDFQRTELLQEKTGVFSGSYAINRFNQQRIPIFVADYVLTSYGTGIVMGVPGHDQRDWDFAKRYGLDIIKVITGGDVSQGAYEKEGKLVNSGQFNNLASPEAREKIANFAEEKGWGKRQVNYKLRDWCISRQRYWGPPIPMIKCQSCGWVPVPEKDLPVKLPYLEDYQPKGLGQASPLAQLKDWVEVKCPQCGGKGERETDVSDTFLDSAWYFFRYLSTDIDSQPFDKRRVKKWLPVDMYIGGAEHSVLHLMYSRFLTMVFHDWGLIDFEEPYEKFRAHGLMIKDGAKMSKSRGNIVVPDEYIKKYGADTLRMYLMFLGPFSQGGDFRDEGIRGVVRFLNRVWNFVVQESKREKGNLDSRRLSLMHQTIKKVTKDIEGLDYNTAIAALMEWLNELEKVRVNQEEVETFLKLLAPFAPHITEELWHLQKDIESEDFTSIHLQPWPRFDPKLVEEKEVMIIVQINGKLRDRLLINREKAKDKELVIKQAKSLEKIKTHLKDIELKQVVFIPGKLVNFVVEDQRSR